MRKRKKNKGFTLLELMIALSLVTVGFLVFFKVINTTQKVNKKNDLNIKALNVLQTEIENLRTQIKSIENLNKENETSLVVYDDSIVGEDKFKKIIFIDDKAEINYIRHNEDKKNNYKINLKIKREMVKGNNNYEGKGKRKSSFNNFKYTIDIESELDNNYFSKKKTKINDVKLLAQGLDSENDDVENVKPEPLSEYNVRIHTSDNWNVNIANESFKVANNSSVNAMNERSLGPDNMDLKNDKFTIRYMPIGTLPNDPFMRLDIVNENNSSKYYTVKEWGFNYYEYDYVSFYIEHTGMQLNNVVINGESVGNISKDVKIPIDKSKSGITIEFHGGTKIMEGGNNGENSHIRSDIFINFTN